MQGGTRTGRYESSRQAPQRGPRAAPPGRATWTRESPSPTVDTRCCPALSIRLSRPSRRATLPRRRSGGPRQFRGAAAHSRRRNPVRAARETSLRGRQQRSVGVFLTRVSGAERVAPAGRLCGGRHSSAARRYRLERANPACVSAAAPEGSNGPPPATAATLTPRSATRHDSPREDCEPPGRDDPPRRRDRRGVTRVRGVPATHRDDP